MELSFERQIEILMEAVSRAKTPVEFYNLIGSYLPYFTSSIFEKYKTKMWIKYLTNLAKDLTFKKGSAIEVRKALALLEGFYYLLQEEIPFDTLSEEEKREIENVKGTIEALKLYKGALLILRELSEEKGLTPARIGASLAKAKGLIRKLEKTEHVPINGLPPPSQLWDKFMDAAREQWLTASLAKERRFVESITEDLGSLKAKMVSLRKKGKEIDVDELEKILEEYFTLVIRYNRSVKELRRLKRKFPASRRELERHKTKLEKIWQELNELKIRNFLTLMVIGKELPPP